MQGQAPQEKSGAEDSPDKDMGYENSPGGIPLGLQLRSKHTTLGAVGSPQSAMRFVFVVPPGVQWAAPASSIPYK